jgi:hypothetical protein
MAGVLCVGNKGSSTTPAASTRYCNAFGFSYNGTTEANSQQLFKTAGVISRLAVRLTGNNNANGGSNTTFTLADTSVQVAFAELTTGYVEDTSAPTTASVAVDDYVSVKCDNTAANGTIAFQAVSFVFSATTNTVQKWAVNGGATLGSAGTTYCIPPTGIIGGATSQTENRITVRTAGTIRSMRVYASANTRSDNTVFTLRKNGTATGLTITLGTGVTSGEDNTNTVTCVSGDQFDVTAVLGAGSGSMTVEQVTFEFETTNSTAHLVSAQAGTVTVTGATDTYPPVGASLTGPSSVETTYQVKAGVACVASNLTIDVLANSGGSGAVVELRKSNGTTALSLTIANGVTGVQLDSDTVSLGADDVINFRVTGTTGGTFRYQGLGIKVDMASASPPNAPTSPSASAASPTQINVSWTGGGGGTPTGHYVEHSTDNSNWTQVDTASATTSHNLTGLTPGTAYYIRIAAYNANGTSSYAQVSGTTTTPPTTPGSFTATPSSTTQIDLSWADSTGETSYELDWSPNGSTGWTSVSTPAAGATSASHTGRTPGTQYFYRLRAIGPNSTASSYATANTTTPPTTPGSFTATPASTTQIDLSWADSTGETSYELDWSPNGSTGWSAVSTPAANATSASHTGLTSGTQYFYRLRAIGPNSTASSYATSNATTPTLVGGTGLTLMGVG